MADHGTSRRGRRPGVRGSRRPRHATAIALIGAVAGLVCVGPEPTGAAQPHDIPQDVRVSGRTDVERVSIGSPFRYTVEIRAPGDVELVVPVLAGRFGDFSVIDFGDEPVRAVGDEVIVTRWYTMVTYQPGLRFIPGPTVQYRPPGGELRRVDGEDVSVQVVSLVDQVPAASDVRDIKPPVSVPFDWTPVLVGGTVLLALALLGVLVARLLRRINAPAAAAPRPSPDVVALEALARLRQRRLAAPEDRAEWFVALSAIVRGYIEGRFGLRAPEMTTEEFIVVVQRDSQLRPDQRQLLGQFLAECDLVKFARVLPDLEAAERAYDAARRFVNETRPTPAAEETARAA